MLRFPDSYSFETDEQHAASELCNEKTLSRSVNTNSNGNYQSQACKISEEQFLTVKTWLRDALLALDESRNQAFPKKTLFGTGMENNAVLISQVAKLSKQLQSEQQVRAPGPLWHHQAGPHQSPSRAGALHGPARDSYAEATPRRRHAHFQVEPG